MTAFPLNSAISISTPFGDGLQFRTLVGSHGLEGVEKRKRKILFPRRKITVMYDNITLAKARLIWQFYLDRSGMWNAFTFFYTRSDQYTKEYVGTGNGTTVLFNLPGKTTTSRILYVDNVVEGSGFNYGSANGTDGEDTVTFDVAPLDGEKITFSFTGYLKIRARFAEDFMSFDVFYQVLTNVGIGIQGLLNDQ